MGDGEGVGFVSLHGAGPGPGRRRSQTKGIGGGGVAGGGAEGGQGIGVRSHSPPSVAFRKTRCCSMYSFVGGRAACDAAPRARYIVACAAASVELPSLGCAATVGVAAPRARGGRHARSGGLGRGAHSPAPSP